MGLKLSKEEQYGIMALIDLSQAGQSARVKSIAERQDIPKRFLEQIFNRLRQADIVVGKRGPAGGYTLARPAHEIKLNTIMAALKPVPTEASTSGEVVTSNGLAGSVTSFWSEVEEQFNQTLGNITLASLRDRTEDLEPEEDFTTDLNSNSFNVV